MQVKRQLKRHECEIDENVVMAKPWDLFLCFALFGMHFCYDDFVRLFAKRSR